MLKKILKKIKTIFHFLIPTESITDSKEKWDYLAQENARYYIFSNQGEGISEEEFRSAGEEDYRTLVLDDPILKETINKSNNVLEIGCGVGRVTEFFAKDFKNVSAIDISKTMIEQAKKRLENYKNIKFVETDGVHYPFASDVFNLAFSFIVFQHMPDKKIIEENIYEIGRVLKEGGVAKIQFRGVKAVKGNWYYGYAVAPREIEEMAKRANLQIMRQSDNNQKYYWVWFRK